MSEPLIGPTRLFVIVSLGVTALVTVAVLTWDSYQREDKTSDDS